VLAGEVAEVFGLVLEEMLVELVREVEVDADGHEGEQGLAGLLAVLFKAADGDYV